jgi:diguanylate cyclase (GGDEF)-like protein
MFSQSQPTFLLASNEPALLEAVEPVLLAAGARPEIVLSAEAALLRMVDPDAPSLALLDTRLPGMEMARLLAAARAEATGPRFPIVLFSDSVRQEWQDRLDEGVIDDVFPFSVEPDFLRFRVEMAVRGNRRDRELEQLREAAALNAHSDTLTGVYNRSGLLSVLFRETDRVQRMNTSLCVILFDIDDFGHWNARLGSAACDELLVQVTGRATRLLRSYDVLGRVGKDEFLAGLPGCSPVNAVLLAERMRQDVFSAPFHVAGKSIRLSACFGVASSQGRSPVIVLREAEQALRLAKEAGPESIKCAADCPQSQAPPVAFLSPTSGDDLLAW